MPDDKTSLLSRLARFGPLSLVQRLRDLLLRPARHELGDARREIAQLREEMAASRRELSALREAVAAGEQRSHASARLALEELLRGTTQVQSDQAARIALLENLLVSSFECAAPAPAGAAEPLVSIVMPVRNRAGCVGEAIASVLAQGYSNWELLVVDDGSSDGTRMAVEGFLGDARIRLASIDHSGPCGARNHALREARGELVAYLDSDNTWFPAFLATTVAAFAADPALRLVYGALASEAHAPGQLRLLLDKFDRRRLEEANYIDLNAVVHRRALFDSLGGFDESLARAVDWDLLLRYSAAGGVRALPVLAARYRVRDQQRITDTVPIGPSWLAIRRTLDPPTIPARRPRVLYVVWHYPQLSETYVEGEIRCLQRWGVDIAVWREVAPVSPYVPPVPVFDGELERVVHDFRPDLIHVHWLQYAIDQRVAFDGIGLPVTLRLHGFDTTREQLEKLLTAQWLHRVYAFPRQLELLSRQDSRVVPVASAFDTSYFEPAAEKDPRLVVRAGACLPSKDIALFFELARRLPGHRFVFCGVTCNEFEHYPEELRRIAAEMQSPVELRFDVPRADMAALLGRAGIYLHTIHPPQVQFGAPIGQPISIAEAMATGAYVLVRDLPELVDYVGDAGSAYADVDDAARLIEASTHWSEDEWRVRRVRASDRGYLGHADELVLRPILDDWCALARHRDAVESAEPAASS